LYHSLVKPRILFFLLLLFATIAITWFPKMAGQAADRMPAGLAQPGPPALGGDRLDRFRQLAGSRLAFLELGGQDPPDDGLQEIYALLDEELIENLNSGPLFGSKEFLQDRLDAFSDAWGGSTFRVLKLAGGELTAGVFQLSPSGQANSVRIYLLSGGRFELGQIIHHPGIPMLFELPPARSGAGQFLLAWVGPQSGRGSAALRVDLWRHEGETARSAWSTATLFRDGLFATGFRVRGQSVTIRYEARYLGWKPGCEGQTEEEDLYQYAPERDTFVLAGRRTIDGWHRELHSRVVSRLLQALAAGNPGELPQLVPDPTVRARLPRQLEADLACDSPNGPVPSEARVPVVSPGDRRVWDLRFRLFSGGWRLVDAVPVERGAGDAVLE
jgi:hypothetical protein